MVKQIVIGVTLFFFFASSFVGSFEELSAGFDVDSQASVWTLENDFSSENATGRRSLKRLKRGKSSLKSLPVLEKIPRVVATVIPIGEISFISHCSKSSVYQQINVYRI
jgi:hypothetical protein